MNNIKIKIFLILIARIVLFTGWHAVIRELLACFFSILITCLHDIVLVL